MNAIQRPRLNERALARLHFVDGRCRVLVHDVESGDVIEIGPREWVLVSAADGTRDIDGLLLAGAREGVHVPKDEVVALFTALSGVGLISSGPPERKVKRSTDSVDPSISGAQESTSHSAASGRGGSSSTIEAGVHNQQKIAPDERKIERIANYSFHCNGHGSCCQLYATIVFSPLEAARARATLPQILDGGERHEHVFMPERGSGPCPGSAVALVNGKCAYLNGNLCGLHKVAGPDSKPLGCNLFPLLLVDDGTTVRASVAVECACVLESVNKPGGAPILADDVYTRKDLDPAVIVDELPREVEVRPEVRVALNDYLAWNDAALKALETAQDAARFAWKLAGLVETFGLDPSTISQAASDAGPLDLWLAPALVKALGRKAARRAKAQNTWRSERDLCRRGVNVVAGAATLLNDDEVLAAVAYGAGAVPQDERFYLHAALFGHQLVGFPLVTSLRDRALAMWIARVFPLAADSLYSEVSEPAFAHPLALVEALLRGHGLRLYTEEVVVPPQ